MRRKGHHTWPAQDAGEQQEGEAEDAERGPSKSAVKRELAGVQALALRLSVLADKQLARLSLSDDARTAVAAVRNLQRRAHQRQLRYASGLLAREDCAQIELELQQLLQPQTRAVRAFHQVEEWRDTLVSGDNALLDELGARFPMLDRQHVMQLVRNALREQREDRPPTAARQLFRYLSTMDGGV
jgi:ribosome-associated protein